MYNKTINIGDRFLVSNLGGYIRGEAIGLSRVIEEILITEISPNECYIKTDIYNWVGLSDLQKSIEDKLEEKETTSKEKELSKKEEFFNKVKGKKIRWSYWNKKVYFIPENYDGNDIMSGFDEKNNYLQFSIFNGFKPDVEPDGYYWEFVKEDATYYKNKEKCTIYKLNGECFSLVELITKCPKSCEHLKDLQIKLTRVEK